MGSIKELSKDLFIKMENYIKGSKALNMPVGTLQSLIVKLRDLLLPRSGRQYKLAATTDIRIVQTTKGTHITSSEIQATLDFFFFCRTILWYQKNGCIVMLT